MSQLHMRISNFSFFFFNDTATTEIYTLSLHDALPIWTAPVGSRTAGRGTPPLRRSPRWRHSRGPPFEVVGWMLVAPRSEEHTSELQSLTNLVCRLLLEKKKIKHHRCTTSTVRIAHSAK